MSQFFNVFLLFRTRSNPVIRRNKIWGGENGGILVYNEGKSYLAKCVFFPVITGTFKGATVKPRKEVQWA